MPTLDLRGGGVTLVVVVVAALAGCAGTARRCQLDGNQLGRAHDPVAPVVVLTEYNNATDVQGGLSLWSDGSMVFEPYLDVVSHARTATTTAAAAESVRASLAALVTGHAPHARLGLVDPVTGSRMVPVHFNQVTLFVRDGDHWLIARVEGVDRDEVLDPQPPREPPSPRAVGSQAILNYVREPAPRWFGDAFLAVLRTIPTDPTRSHPFAWPRYRGKRTVQYLQRCIDEHTPPLTVATAPSRTTGAAASRPASAR